MAFQLIHAAGRHSKLYYDKENSLYAKGFPEHKWYSRRGLKQFLGIAKTPGRNIEYITKKLESVGVACPELVEVQDYWVTFKECRNTQTLREYCQIHGDDALVTEQAEVFKKLLNVKLLHADPNNGNFLYDGEKLIIIDLDALHYSPWKFLPRQLLLYRLWRHRQKNDELVHQVAKAWPKRSFIHSIMDIIYTFRTYLKVYVLKKDKEELIFVQKIDKYIKEVHSK